MRTRTEAEEIAAEFREKRREWVVRRDVIANTSEIVRDAALGKLTPMEISYLRRAFLEIEKANENGLSAPCAIDEFNHRWLDVADREV